MMCQPCRDSGDLMATFIHHNEPDLPDFADLVIARAVELHGKCPGGTHCTCQHHVGEVRRKTS